MPVELLFCDTCNVSIPQADADSGRAVKLDHKWYCADCNAKRSLKEDAVCAMCNKPLPAGTLKDGGATKIAGHLYCRRCAGKRSMDEEKTCAACGHVDTPLYDGSQYICRKCGGSVGRAEAGKPAAVRAPASSARQGTSSSGNAAAVASVIGVVALLIAFGALFRVMQVDSRASSFRRELLDLNGQVKTHASQLRHLKQDALVEDIRKADKDVSVLAAKVGVLENALRALRDARKEETKQLHMDLGRMQSELETVTRQVKKMEDQAESLIFEDIVAQVLEDPKTDDGDTRHGKSGETTAGAEAHDVTPPLDPKRRKKELFTALKQLNSDNSTVRFAAVFTLHKLGGDDVVQPLIRMLKDPDESVRAAAAGGLEPIASPEALQPLLAAAGDANWTVRVAVLKALSRYEDEDVITIMKAASRDPDADDMERYLAAEYLKRMRR